MKTIFTLLILLCAVQISIAQENTHQLKCTIKSPLQKTSEDTDNPITPFSGTGKVVVYYVVPADASYQEEEYQSVRNISRSLQGWYKANTGGVTYTFAEKDTVITYYAQRPSGFYKADWWNKLLTEMRAQGQPIFREGSVASIWVKTNNNEGLLLGAQDENNKSGVAMAAIENIPQFNNTCSGKSGPDAYPCVPYGVMAHSLGHAFGLVHPYDVEETKDVALHSVMQTYWNLDAAEPTTSPWGLLAPERLHLRNNPYFMSGITTKALYEPNIVNLPATTPAPEVQVDYTKDGLQVAFSSENTQGELFYWYFGDGTTSTEPNPTHVYAQNGTYTVQLFVSCGASMMAENSFTIEVMQPLAAAEEVKEQQLLAYPNPSTDGRYKVQLHPQPLASLLLVTDLQGKVVLQQQIPALQQEISLDLRHVRKGTYLLRIQQKSSTMRTKLVRI